MGVDNVPAPLRLAASLSWRFLVVAVAVAVIALGAAALAIIVIPVSVALLISTQLAPSVMWLRRRGLPAMLAAVVVLLCSFVLIAAISALIVPPVLAQRADFEAGLQTGVRSVSDWLLTGPFGLPSDLAQRVADQLDDQLGANAGAILGGVATGASGLLTLVFGLILTLFLVLFFLQDGDAIWAWTVHLFPDQHQAMVRVIGSRGWEALGGYVRGVAMVGLTEAIVIGGALWMMGVPIVLPLAAIVFAAAAVPLAGFPLAGVLAMLIALVTKGPIVALIVTAIVIVVGQLEGPVIRPFFVGHSVGLHPLAVLLAVVAGAVLWGIPGAFLALPLSMLIVVAAEELYGHHRDHTHSPSE